MIDRYILPPLVALLYLALTGIVVDRGGWLIRTGLANVGRMALSCYILQNIAGSVLFYGWGFGLASTLEPHGPWPVFAIYLTMCLAMIALSTLWLKRFRQGPFEALWRALTPRGA